MFFTRLWLIACLAAGLCFCPLHTAADIAPVIMIFKGGGALAPKSPHKRIRLDSQEVVIRLNPHDYRVDAQFNLFNEGEAVTEWIGFPKWAESRLDCYPTFNYFKGSINGKGIEFTDTAESCRGRRPPRPGSHGDWRRLADRPLKGQGQWLASRVTFPRHARAMIHITYCADYYGKHDYQALYVYGTGSLWKGKIGKAVFIVDSTGRRATHEIAVHFHFRKGSESGIFGQDMKSQPRPMTIRKNVLRFELRDFDPDRRAYLSIKIKGWRTIPGYLRGKTSTNLPNSSGDSAPARFPGPREVLEKTEK